MEINFNLYLLSHKRSSQGVIPPRFVAVSRHLSQVKIKHL
ncbi:hypothetical protein FORC066_1073 [Yersinia enterocolitica]|nr:hypothetical protein FORC066_1073 [Yersinia enterocolitica]